jgi:hypothetical protein
MDAPSMDENALRIRDKTNVVSRLASTLESNFVEEWIKLIGLKSPGSLVTSDFRIRVSRAPLSLANGPAAMKLPTDDEFKQKQASSRITSEHISHCLRSNEKVIYVWKLRWNIIKPLCPMRISKHHIN